MKAVRNQTMNHKLVYICIVSFLLFFCGCGKQAELVIGPEETPAPAAASEEEIPPQERGTLQEIGVYVCGAVVNPGIYYLKDGARMQDAVDAAGGMREDAAAAAVNLAAYIHDCDQIYIPTVTEQAEVPAQAAEANAKAEDGKVNINQADAEELCTLPGIGAAKAESIITYRTQNGPFQSIEDIKNISGIKDAVFEKIRDLICT